MSEVFDEQLVRQLDEAHERVRHLTALVRIAAGAIALESLALWILLLVDTPCK